MNEQGPETPGEGSDKQAEGMEAIALYEQAKADAEAALGPHDTARSVDQPTVLAAEAGPPESMYLGSPIKVDPFNDPIRAYEQATNAKEPPEKLQSDIPETIKEDKPPMAPRPPSPTGDAVNRQVFSEKLARDRATADAAKNGDKKNVEKPPFTMPKSDKPQTRDWSQVSMGHDFSEAINDDGGIER